MTGLEKEQEHWKRIGARGVGLRRRAADELFAMRLLGKNARGKSCLELGPGEGKLYKHLARRFHKVACLEIDPQKTPELINLGYEIVQGDAAEMGETVDNAYYDLIISRHVLEHVEKIWECVAGQYTVLRHGGWAMHEVPVPPNWEPAHVTNFYRHEWALLFERVGFTVYECREVSFLGIGPHYQIKARKGNHLKEGSRKRWWETLDMRE